MSVILTSFVQHPPPPLCSTILGHSADPWQCTELLANPNPLHKHIFRSTTPWTERIISIPSPIVHLAHPPTYNTPTGADSPRSPAVIKSPYIKLSAITRTFSEWIATAKQLIPIIITIFQHKIKNLVTMPFALCLPSRMTLLKLAPSSRSPSLLLVLAKWCYKRTRQATEQQHQPVK